MFGLSVFCLVLCRIIFFLGGFWDDDVCAYVPHDEMRDASDAGI